MRACLVLGHPKRPLDHLVDDLDLGPQLWRELAAAANPLELQRGKSPELDLLLGQQQRTQALDDGCMLSEATVSVAALQGRRRVRQGTETNWAERDKGARYTN